MASTRRTDRTKQRVKEEMQSGRDFFLVPKARVT